MRQVPNSKSKYSYLIVGNGKLSKHFQHYFKLKSISYKIFTRNSKEAFQSLAQNSKRILVLINDDELLQFIKSNKKKSLQDKIWIHCSGSLSTPLAESAHPLMTFTDQLYDLEFYESIVFITEQNKKDFKELFPELNNKSYKINSEEKEFYHAMCVISGNFTTILWKIFFDYLESKNIPQASAHNYLKAVTKNLIENSNPLTGPIQRNDKKLIHRHLQILNGSPLQNVYKSFLEAYKILLKDNKIEINK